MVNEEQYEKTSPGISRNDRISDEGLMRLEKQLISGARLSPAVLEQWVRRYGEAAETLIRQYAKNLPPQKEGDSETD